LRFFGPAAFNTPNTTILKDASTCSMAFTLKMNSLTSDYLGTILSQLFYGFLATNTGVASQPAFQMEFGFGPYILDYIYYHLGTVYTVLMSWNAGNPSYVWVNGIQAYTITHSGGSWLDSNVPITLGWAAYDTATIDFQIEDIAIWPTYAATVSDAIALRDRTKTPLQVGNNNVTWWTCGGTLGAHPQVGDPGLQDSGTIGLNFTSLTNASNAVYAAPLVYSPPVTMSWMITKNAVAAGFATVTSTGLLDNITSITSSPTFNVQWGGSGAQQAVQSQGPFWSSSTNRFPHAMWQLSCGTVTSVLVQGGGSGYTSPTATATGCVLGTPVVSGGVIQSIPLVSSTTTLTAPPTVTITDANGTSAAAVAIMSGPSTTDHVFWTGVSDGWLSTGTGVAAGYPSPYVPSNQIANYVGHLEPGVGGYQGSNIGVNQRTLQLGFNIPGYCFFDFPFYGHSNWFKRVANESTIATTTPDYKPLTISSQVNLRFCSAGWSAIDPKGNPSPVGVWSFLADETAPSTPMTIGMRETIGVGSVAAATPTPGLVTYGVKGVTLTSKGSGYTDIPTVTFSGGGGVGAAAYAVLSGNGTIAGVYLTATGTGYASTPTMAITSRDGNGSGATASCTASTVEAGKSWMFTVSRTASSVYFMNLELQVSGYNGSYPAPYTLVNEFIFEPADNAASSPGLPSRSNTTNQAMRTWLKTSTALNPLVFRNLGQLGSAGASSVVDAEDWPNYDSWTWGYAPVLSGSDLAARPTARREILVTQVRTYALTTSGWPSSWNVTHASPKVYTPQWGTANATFSGYGTTGDTSGPYYVTPTDQTYLTYLQSTGWFVGECVCSAPHNLKFGQAIGTLSPADSGDTGTFLVSIDNSGNTAQWTLSGSFTLNSMAASYFLNAQAFPTGSTTFAFAVPAGSSISGWNTSFTSLPGNVANVAGTFNVHDTLLVDVPTSNSPPHETCAAVTAAFPGTMHWLNLPWGISDAGAASAFRRIRDILPPGHNVAVEYCNEIWNVFILLNNAAYIYAATELGFWGTPVGNNPDNVQRNGLIRANQLKNIGVNIFNEVGRGSSVKLVAPSWYGSPGQTQVYMQAAVANNITVDILAYAYYADVLAEGSMFAAFASLASNNPRSIAYLSATPWTRPQIHDYLRFQMLYDSLANGPSGLLQQHVNAINTYYTLPGPKPKIIGYEGALETIVPPGIETAVEPSGSPYWLRGQLTRDLWYDPEMYNTEMAWYISSQSGGQNGVPILELGQPFATTAGGPIGGTGANVADGNACLMWPYVAYQEQPVGRGDGTLASNGQNITNTFQWPYLGVAQDLYNASPRMAAYQNWAATTGVTGPGGSTMASTMLRRWFPGLSFRARLLRY
jgi:hypothetical protein